MPRARQLLLGAIGLVVLSALAACGTSRAIKVKAAAVPAGAAWRSSAKLGSWKDAGFDVYNNEWNKSAAGPQTIWAYSYQHWGVRSEQPSSASVKTYPCVQQNFRNPTLSSITRLVSTFTQAMPPVAARYDAEAAYDLWLNGYQVEVMVWVDNHGQTPEGGVIDQAVISGRPYDVYQGGARMFSFVISGRPEPAGQVDLLTPLHWLIRHHYVRGSDVLTQVNFGWEIASTGGGPMDFSLTRYTLSTNVH